LTNRELEVLRLLAKGATTGAIANQLHISRTTVNNHIQRLLHKLNAHSRLEAIRRAERAGLI
jgi:DNA-binding NarL/FixJ family response regulator